MEKEKEKKEESASAGVVGVFTSKKMSETFLRTLECPVCLEIVVPPVISCTYGHIICSMCRPKLLKCGLCGSSFTNIRNYPIEAMLGLVETECRYNSCSVKLMADKLKEHLLVCEYRPVACREHSVTAECTGQLINFEDYPRHLMDVHGKSYVDLSVEYPEFVVYDVSTNFNGSQMLGVMNFKNRTFFLCREYLLQSKVAMCWIVIMGTVEEARNYVFHLKIPHPKDQEITLQYTIRAHSIHTSPEQMGPDCIQITYNSLIQFCDRKYVHTSAGQGCEYKWSMIGKVKESEFPPPQLYTSSITSIVAPTVSVPSQVNPLNLCSSGGSYNSNSNSSASGGNSIPILGTTNQNSSFLNYTPTPLASSVSFPISGTALPVFSYRQPPPMAFGLTYETVPGLGFPTTSAATVLPSYPPRY